MKIKISVLLVLLIAVSNQLFSQARIELDNVLQKNGVFQFATFKAGPADNAAAKSEVLKSVTNNDPTLRFIKTETQVLDKTNTQEKYQLYKNGIKLRGGELLINSHNKTLQFIHGFAAPVKEEGAVNPRDKAVFTKKAIAYFEEAVTATASSLAASPLIYYFSYQSEKYQLAYEVYLEASKNFRAENVYVSAIDGSLLGSESRVCQTNFPGSAQTQYNGTQNIVTDAPTAAGPFRLFETRGPNNVVIRTRNNNFAGTNVAGATEITDNDNNWTFAEHGTLRAGFDAHWGAESVLDYWRTVHNRNSINNAGMMVDNYVNVDVGANPVNAFWFNSRMYYGNGFAGGNVTCLDVCAHEFGHGIDEYTGSLAYERESGALDEGFADIWGACVEAWRTPGKQRWLIGEDLNVGPIRNMANPNQFNQPDTYQGNLWANTNCGTPQPGNDYCGVHTNSGVLNYWFFLISDGGAGTNDLGNPFNVAGLGINTAAQIAYRTKTLLNNSLANYGLCRQVSIQAAIQLFGNCSNEVVQVTNAWFAVGVGAAWTTPNYQLFSSYGQDCSSVTVTANFPGSSNVTWTTTNGLLINGNSSPVTLNSNVVTISSPNGSGGTISATIGGSCSASGISFCPCEPWDNPSITWIYSAPATNEPLEAIVSPDHPNATRYEWYVNGQLIETTYSSFLITYNWPCTSEGEGLSVVAITPCGPTAPVYGGTYSPICYQYLVKEQVKVFPNPAQSQVTIRLDDAGSKTAPAKDSKGNPVLSSITRVRLVDKTGITRSVQQFVKGMQSVTIDVSGLPSDIYYLDITDGVNSIRKPLIVQR
ncbi:MAG: M4 family metallopeptidase [Ferruginibacter sp.]